MKSLGHPAESSRLEKGISREDSHISAGAPSGGGAAQGLGTNVLKGGKGSVRGDSLKRKKTFFHFLKNPSKKEFAQGQRYQKLYGGRSVFKDFQKQKPRNHCSRVLEEHPRAMKKKVS